MAAVTISFRADEQTMAELRLLAGDGNLSGAIRELIHAQYAAQLYGSAARDAEGLRDEPADLAAISAVNKDLDEISAWLPKSSNEPSGSYLPSAEKLSRKGPQAAPPGTLPGAFVEARQERALCIASGEINRFRSGENVRELCKVHETVLNSAIIACNYSSRLQLL